MNVFSPRLLVPVAAAVLVWGAAHALGSRDASITPAVWPLSTTAPATALPAAAGAPAGVPSPAAASGVPEVPVLPGALQQLNGATASTAAGVFVLLQQLEGALASRLEGLAHRLEPGR